ncbi:hypothetical protein DPMN_074344 [Dreissena polymorpha]|uniref:Uncharacterized protein n=1 Tax=Dreissena polymorpha TaxID=45954 RepID=A0A9D3YF31_DREPO|nr:hypothetical protein DPMN_074344 [Dreissena polymorpha]
MVTLETQMTTRNEQTSQGQDVVASQNAVSVRGHPLFSYILHYRRIPPKPFERGEG